MVNNNQHIIIILFSILLRNKLDATQSSIKIHLLRYKILLMHPLDLIKTILLAQLHKIREQKPNKTKSCKLPDASPLNQVKEPLHSTIQCRHESRSGAGTTREILNRTKIGTLVGRFIHVTLI